MRTPYETLTEKDKTDIFNYLMWNSHNCGAAEPWDRTCHNVLCHWDLAKRDFLDMFNGELILTKRVKVPFARHIAEESFYGNSKISPFLDQVLKILYYTRDKYWYYLDFINEIKFKANWLFTWDAFSERCRVLHQNPILIINTLISHVFNDSAILDAKVDWTEPDHTIYVPYNDTDSIRIQKGEKTMRVIGKIVRTCFPFLLEEYEEFRLEISRIFNSSKLEGDLCISIHPLDYMTMSDNSSRWSSCMSWEDIGDYRAGTVEMMNSESVVIAYLKSDSEEYVKEDVHWNSKKWRSLFIVTNGAIVSVKGYPFQNEFLSKTVLEWLKELYNKEYYNTIDTDDFATAELHTLTGRETGLFTTNNMYNDFGTTTHYGYLSSSWSNMPFHSINYSGVLSCMSCGQLWDTEDSSNRYCKVNCDECLDPDDDDYEEEEEEENTYDDYTSDYIYEDDATTVFIIDAPYEEIKKGLDQHPFVFGAFEDYQTFYTHEGNIEHTIDLHDLEKTTDDYHIGSILTHYINGIWIISTRDQNYDDMESFDEAFLKQICGEKTIEKAKKWLSQPTDAE